MPTRKRFSGLLAGAALVLLPAFAFAQLPQAHELDWLCKTWKGSLGKQVFYESWKQVNAGAWTGIGFRLEEGDTIIQEQLRIQAIGDFLVYISIVGKQQPILFTCINWENNHWVFENKEHDFPRYIYYTMNADGSLEAGIEGEQDGKVKQIKYPMKPQRSK